MIFIIRSGNNDLKSLMDTLTHEQVTQYLVFQNCIAWVKKKKFYKKKKKLLYKKKKSSENM